MNNQSSKKKTFIILIAFLIVCFSLIFFVVLPLVEKVYREKDLLEEEKLTLERDKQNVERYKKDLDYLEKKTSLSEELIINEDNRLKLIEDLEKIAVEQNLELNIETFSKTTSNKKVKKEETKISLKLNLTGEYQNFMKFLYQLQNFRYPIEVDSFEIENFDDSKIKNIEELQSLDDVPEIESEIIISFS